MTWTPKLYEDRPVLRERVLAAAAIGTILVGGAMATDTMLTGGWQWGVVTASASSEPQYYYDDTNEQWRAAAPSVAMSRPVTLAETSQTQPQPPTLDARSLDGDTPTVALTSYQPNLSVDAQTQAPPTSATVDDDASKARFDQLEADVRQADPSQSDGASDATAKN